MKIGLISHLIRDYNLGCSALAVSNIKLLDQIAEENNLKVEYVIILAEPKENINIEKFVSLEQITKNKYSYRTYPRLKKILKQPWSFKKSQAFKDLDLIIDLCGGDGYTDNYGLIRLIAESVPVYGGKINKVPVIFAPQTIGPFNTKIGNIIAKHTLKKIKRIYVRDNKSYECCQKMNLNNKVKQVIDVAFALPYKKRVLNNKKFNIGINISGLLYNGGYNHNNYFKLSFSYKEFIDRLLETLSKEKNTTIHLISHVIDDKPNVDDDYCICERIKSIYPNMILAPKFKSASDAKEYISGMDLFSGARMHATIAATSSGVPVIPVAYSRKFNGLYDTLEYKFYIDAKSNITEDDAIELFLQYKNNMQELKKSISRAKIIYDEALEEYKNDLSNLLKL